MGSAVITIRSFTTEDISEAAALESAHQPVPWSEAIFADELARDDRIYLVAEDDGMVGFTGVVLIGDEAHVTNLLVDPARRRRGVGRALMIAIIEAAVKRGARHITLEVRTHNWAARAFYAGLGLAPVGVRPGYYGGEDALIMWAHDIDDPAFLESLR